MIGSILTAIGAFILGILGSRIEDRYGLVTGTGLLLTLDIIMLAYLLR